MPSRHRSSQRLLPQSATPHDIRTLIGREPDIDMLVDSLRGNMGDTLGFYVKLSMDAAARYIPWRYK